jgi:hypothetical protein
LAWLVEQALTSLLHSLELLTFVSVLLHSALLPTLVSLALLVEQALPSLLHPLVLLTFVSVWQHSLALPTLVVSLLQAAAHSLEVASVALFAAPQLSLPQSACAAIGSHAVTPIANTTRLRLLI